MGQTSLPHITSRNQTASWARPANSARRSTFQPATTEAGTFAGLWTAQTEWRRRARPLTLCRQGGPRSGLRRRPGVFPLIGCSRASARVLASAGGARLAKLRSPICYETLRRLRSFLLMTDHPMFLEYDWTSNTYRSHLCGAFTSVAHSFETLAASRHALHLIGLRIGDKTDERTWRIEFMEPVAERADFSRLGGWAK
jgi:hypothetical protein